MMESGPTTNISEDINSTYSMEGKEGINKNSHASGATG